MDDTLETKVSKSEEDESDIDQANVKNEHIHEESVKINDEMMSSILFGEVESEVKVVESDQTPPTLDLEAFEGEQEENVTVGLFFLLLFLLSLTI